MSNVLSKELRYQEIALAHFRGGEFTIEEITDTLLREKFFTEEELAKATYEWAKSETRKVIRKPHFDEDGNRLEQVNIKRPNPDPDQKQQVFAYLDEIVEEDFQIVIEGHLKRRKYFTDEIVRLLGIYQERFGKRARNLYQRRLNLDFDVEA